MDESAIRYWLSSKFLGDAPKTVEAIGGMQDRDGSHLAYISFTTKRDIISEIVATPSLDCPPAMKAALAVVCFLAQGKAVMAADLIGPDDVLGVLGSDDSDESFYTALMAVLTLKNALSSYADYRHAENARSGR